MNETNSSPAGSSSRLVEQLKERIRRAGRLTYAAFLEMILYDEHYGYYRAGKQDKKDYVTSPEIHGLFGNVIGTYIEECCNRGGKPSVTILELGGASGRLARDIISAIRTPLDRYLIVEKGTERKEGKIEWVNGIDRIGPLKGFTFVVANEFFDALPFHRIMRADGILREIYIGFEDGFFEQVDSLSEEIKGFLQRYPLFLREHQTSEVANGLEPIITQLSAKVTDACLLVFDYGYHQSDLAQGRFSNGSMLAYRGWTIRQGFLDSLGKTDVTHHVNFDHLSALLEAHGWRKEGEIAQYRFLCRIGLLEGFEGLPQQERLSAKWLLNPEGLGSMISVLGFSRHSSFPLHGFGKT